MKLGVRPLAILRHALHELRDARYSAMRPMTEADAAVADALLEGCEAAESMIEALLTAHGLECNGAMVPGRTYGVIPVPAEGLEHHGDSCPIHEVCSLADCGARGEWAREVSSLEDVRRD